MMAAIHLCGAENSLEKSPRQTRHFNGKDWRRVRFDLSPTSENSIELPENSLIAKSPVLRSDTERSRA